jgi:nitronate monooxygenase
MTISLETNLCGLLGIQYPIFQAGMAGKITNPKLVAAVSNAGGLGILGAAYMSPEQIAEALLEVRKLTDKPFGVNLFQFRPSSDKGNVHAMDQFLAHIRKQLGITHHDNDVTYLDYQQAQLELVLRHQVPILSFTFSLPSPEIMKQIKAKGIVTTMMVTTVKEAILAEEAGIDILIAQGSEAGGHRGTFDVKTGDQGALIGTMSLVPQIVDHTSLPVVAAGGIMDGRGLVGALALGAQGVQLGTRFLLAHEADTHSAYREQLLQSTEEDTVITSMFSGRPARAIKNQFIEETLKEIIEPLPYPWQNEVTQDIRKAAAQQNDPRFMSLWSGQSLRLAKEEKDANTIVHEIMEQARKILG